MGNILAWLMDHKNSSHNYELFLHNIIILFPNLVGILFAKEFLFLAIFLTFSSLLIILSTEMVMNIEIPYKQKSLKAGKAQMRIRNTGFTITSLDGPPKCMGSWQILHIRKFGGSDSFRFETGNPINLTQ